MVEEKEAENINEIRPPCAFHKQQKQRNNKKKIIQIKNYADYCLDTIQEQ